MAGGKSVGNTEFQKRANDALILDQLRRNGPLSRIELVERTGLHQSTVTYIVNRLIAYGIVAEDNGAGISEKRGRKPIPLNLEKNFGFVLGMDICGQHCRLVVCDIAGEVRYTEERATDPSAESYEDSLVEHYRYIEAMAEQENWRLIAVGVSVSGVVDPVHGTVRRSWMEELTDYPLAKRLTQKIGHPVLIENDANCCAYAKLWEDRKNEQGPSFLYLLLRDTIRNNRPHKHQLPISIGMGLVLEGAVYHGASNLAGEYRSVSPTKGIVRNQLTLSEEELARFASEEGTRRKAMIEILSNMVLLLIALNPDTLYIGGDFSMSEEWLADIIDRELELRTKFPQIANCDIRLSGLAMNDTAYGACAFVLSSIYSIPMIGRKSALGPLDWETLFKLTRPADPVDEL